MDCHPKLTPALPDGLLKTKTVYDGLDHAVMEQAANGAFSERAFNYLDKVCAVSNPDYTDPGSLSCNASNNPTLSGTGGISYFAYDSLGRQTSRAHQDGSTQTWTYSNNSVTFKNENGTQWTRTSDALGRLTKVLEPNGASQSPSMETDYGYDPLGDLTSVTQWGGASGSGNARSRTFTYDSLSRLLCASNPENTIASCPTSASGPFLAGSLLYTYDANSNVKTTSDARGVVATYSYDQVNRRLSKTYTGAPAGALSACFQYDSAMGGNGLPGAEWTQVGSCPQSPPSPGYQSLRVFGAYDGMRRVVSEQQCVLGFCTSAAPPAPPQANCGSLPTASGISFCYDLAGDLTAYSNGLNSTAFSQQSVLFSQRFDTAGRLSSVTSSWSGPQLPSNLITADPASGYAAFGALQSWTLGGGNLSVTKSFDNRQRVTAETATQQ